MKTNRLKPTSKNPENRPKKPVNPYTVTGISFESKVLLTAAKARAKTLHMSLSKYICTLIRKETARGGTMTLEPEPFNSTQKEEQTHRTVSDLVKHPARGTSPPSPPK